MLKQSPSRNQRTKGFKVTQGFKIFVLIAVGIWLIYQLKHSHDKKKATREAGKLGRKGLNPYELMDDTEESKPEGVKEQSRGADDDIIGRDRDRVEEEEPEEVEDLIDEEDKEKEEENEDEDEVIKKRIEDMNLLEDQGRSEGEKDTQATSERHYRENGASRVVMRFGGLRKLKEESSKVSVPSTDSSPKVVDNVAIEHVSSPNVWLRKGKDGVLNAADSGSGSNSDSLLD